jgi:hypothetical protein
LGLLYGFKDILVQPFVANRAIGSRDIAVLLWLARLDIVDGNAALFGPVYQ